MRDRKHPELWQAYLFWEELMKLRQRHLLRIEAIEDGRSNMLLYVEEEMMSKIGIDHSLDLAKKFMRDCGEDVGPIWDWLRNIKGLKAGFETAKLVALIDDIGRFDTVSKLWRHAGYAVIDGEIDRKQSGKTLVYNTTLKSCVWMIVKLFIQLRTPLYRDIYDDEKERQRRIHPNIICTKCGHVGGVKKGQNWFCGGCGCANNNHALMYTPAHLDARAIRKTAKIFLQHVWVKWREFEGLEVSKPWVHDIGGHTNYIPPPEFDEV